MTSSPLRVRLIKSETLIGTGGVEGVLYQSHEHCRTEALVLLLCFETLCGSRRTIQGFLWLLVVSLLTYLCSCGLIPDT